MGQGAFKAAHSSDEKEANSKRIEEFRFGKKLLENNNNIIDMAAECKRIATLEEQLKHKVRTFHSWSE